MHEIIIFLISEIFVVITLFTYLHNHVFFYNIEHIYKQSFLIISFDAIPIYLVILLPIVNTLNHLTLIYHHSIRGVSKKLFFIHLFFHCKIIFLFTHSSWCWKINQHLMLKKILKKFLSKFWGDFDLFQNLWIETGTTAMFQLYIWTLWAAAGLIFFTRIGYIKCLVMKNVSNWDFEIFFLQHGSEMGISVWPIVVERMCLAVNIGPNVEYIPEMV